MFGCLKQKLNHKQIIINNNIQITYLKFGTSRFSICNIILYANLIIIITNLTPNYYEQILFESKKKNK